MQNKMKNNTGAILLIGGLLIALAVLVNPAFAIGLPALALGNVTIDLKNELSFATISDIAARTSTVTTSAVDLKEYLGKIAVIQQVGTVSGTSPTLDGKIQDSADGSTGWTDISVTATQVTASNSQQVLSVDTRVARRYIRYVGTIAGTTPSFTMGIVLVGQKQYNG